MHPECLPMNRYQLNIPLLLLVTVVVSCLSFIGFTRLRIDTDIVVVVARQGTSAITDALTIFHNHPIHDQVAVDIAIDRPTPDTLIERSCWLRERMAASGPFAEVGMDDVGALLPDLAQQVVLDLPMLFSGKQLEEQVAPMLEPEAIRRRPGCADAGPERSGGRWPGPGSWSRPPWASGTGAGPADPSGAHVADASFYKGQLLSEDGRHLLLVARPKAAGSTCRPHGCWPISLRSRATNWPAARLPPVMRSKLPRLGPIERLSTTKRSSATT